MRLVRTVAVVACGALAPGAHVWASGPGVRASGSGVWSSGPPGWASGPAAWASGPPAPQAGRIVLAIVDDLNATDTQRAALARELDRTRRALIRDDDLLAIMSTGRSSVEAGLGYDLERKRTARALARITAESTSVPRAQQPPRYFWHESVRFVHAGVIRHGQSPSDGPRVLFLIADESGAFSDDRMARATALTAGRSSLDPIPFRGPTVTEDTLTADLATLLATADRLGVEVYHLAPSGFARRNAQ